MATVNTASVREEIARVEQEIARLSETGVIAGLIARLFACAVAIRNGLAGAIPDV